MENLSVIFLSDNNNILGAKIKSVVDSSGLNLTYSNSLSVVMDIVSDSGRAVVFVDKIYAKYINIASLMTQSKCFNNVLVAFVDNDPSLYLDYLNTRLCVIPESSIEYNISNILQSCRQCVESRIKVNMRVVSDILSGYLSTLGFSPKHSGYRYIKQCVEYAVQNCFDVGKSLYREVYLVVGKRNNESIHAIERNIRHAISQAFQNTGFETIGFESLKTIKVTNRMFLSYLVDKLSTDKRVYVLDDVEK